MDMIFGARQLIEKTIEHDTKMFVLFVDLRNFLIPCSGQ